MRYLIVGASRGIGLALSKELPSQEDELICVSRTAPQIKPSRGKDVQWVYADATSESFSSIIKDAVGNKPVDVFIYAAGISEKAAFDELTEKEISDVLRTNLESFVRLAQALLPNLVSSEQKMVVAIASTCGLPNEGASKVAYAASKFGMRGAAHALREVLRPHNGRVTVISPGSIASDIDVEEGTEAVFEKYGGGRMPTQDIVETVRYLLSLSPAACVKEIHIPATPDTDV